MSKLEQFLKELKLTPKQMENFSHRNNNVNFSLSLSPLTSTSGEGMQVDEEDYKVWNPDEINHLLDNGSIQRNVESIKNKCTDKKVQNLIIKIKGSIKYYVQFNKEKTSKYIAIQYDNLLQLIYADNYQTKFPKKDRIDKVREFVDNYQGKKEEKKEEKKEDIDMQDDEKDNTNSLRESIKGYLDLEGLTDAEIEEILEKVDTDYKDYKSRKQDNEEGKEEAFDEVVETVRDKANYLTKRYSDKQLEKTFENMLSSMGTINKRGIFSSKIDQCDYETILKYLCFIKDNPQFALPTLLWLDTFHDFKEERLMASVELEEGSKRKKEKLELNKIIDYICYRIYGNNHWANLEKYSYYKDNKKKTDFEAVKDCINIGHTYNFDKMYQNSFFEFAIDYSAKAFQYYGSGPRNNCAVNPNNNICRVKVTGFHKDVEHTVLKPLVEGDHKIQESKKKEVAKLLYDVSNVFIADAEGWESDFLYMYMLYNFEFNIGEGSRNDFLNDLRQISTDSITRRDIPYYAKDVDKASAHYLKGDLVVLPASIFDANPSNSSKSPDSFVSIPKTTIPYCNGYNFIYNFTGDVEPCKLTLNYGNGITSYAVCNTDRSLSAPTCEITSREALKDINSSIKELSKLMNSIYIYSNDNEGYIQNEFNTLKERIKGVYFENNNCVKLPPNKQGMSPVDIISVVIGLLLRGFTPATKKRKSPPDHPLSPISCKELDFWVALKRIGDFGQILQCKQLGIPLFTNDNMQILISIAACSSVVFTIDNSKAIWYDGFEDAFMKNNLAKEYECYREDEYECTIKRIEKDKVKETLEKLDIIEGILHKYKFKDYVPPENFEKEFKPLLGKEKDDLIGLNTPRTIQDTKASKDEELLNKRREEINTFIQEQKNIITYKGVINSSFKDESFKDRDCKSSSSKDDICKDPSEKLKTEKTYFVPDIRDNCVLSISPPLSSFSSSFSSSSLNYASSSSSSSSSSSLPNTYSTPFLNQKQEEGRTINKKLKP